MGRKLHYKPGSYYVTDDRTGFPQRADKTRKEWTGLRVDENVWEPRQPQDFLPAPQPSRSYSFARSDIPMPTASPPDWNALP